MRGVHQSCVHAQAPHLESAHHLVDPRHRLRQHWKLPPPRNQSLRESGWRPRPKDSRAEHEVHYVRNMRQRWTQVLPSRRQPESFLLKIRAIQIYGEAMERAEST
jgi:hypothetical protein